MGGESERVTKVKIYNRTYPVRSGGDAEYVRRLAEYVNEKMNEVSEHTLTVDTLKVAVLAALNIADDYFAAKQELDSVNEMVSEESKKMAALLDPFLQQRAP
jgi:cell division protein ZapA